MLPKEKVVIITPCFNENVTVIKFIEELEVILSAESLYEFNIVVVDDASTDNTLELLRAYQISSANIKLSVLRLRYNLGHQGAIHQGLLFSKNYDSNKFIVIDSDGEDDPNAIKELIQFNNVEIVNVVRAKRNEDFTFRFSYVLYKLIFKLITGKQMNFGNYCLISKKVVDRVANKTFIHFPAHVSKLKFNTQRIVYDRRPRIDGKSKMNLTSLVYHAFRSFIEYAEDLLMIFLKLFAVIGIMMIVLIGVILYKKFYSHEAILGWASTMTIGLFSIGLICFGFFVLGILLLNIMSKSSNQVFQIFEEVK